MKSFRLLLPRDLLPTIERMCKALGFELGVVDPEPIWLKQNRRVFQIDVPDFHFRVLEETAGLKGVSTDTLLHSWIEEYSRELADKGRRNYRGVMEARFRLMAGWEGTVKDLALRLAKG